jgi:hypothetical protein
MAQFVWLRVKSPQPPLKKGGDSLFFSKKSEGRSKLIIGKEGIFPSFVKRG